MHTVKTALESLQQASRAALELVDGLSDTQWRLRPAGQEWSLAETIEHVVVSDRAILSVLERLPAAPPVDEATRIDDPKISLELFRGNGPAPKLAEPTGRFATLAEGVAALGAVCDGFDAWANAKRDVELRSHGLPHPLFGVFDGVQWILFAAVHTDSHVRQLQALRACPGLELRPSCI
jgi:hypothetical protein